MPRKQNRRDFIKATAATVGAGYFVAAGSTAQASRSANEEIRFGCIGINGKGSSDSGDAKANGKVVAICDIDDSYLDKVIPGFPGAKRYNDYRKMLEEMDKSIDAVTISTPDHMHAVIATMAMKMGKHCFCQKPLTHSIEEARVLGTLARDSKVVTQMGNQGTAESNLRLSAALIKAGKVGTVKEVHVFTNRPVWPQSKGLKVKTAPDAGKESDWNAAKSKVHWDLWIGCAKDHAYSPEIHPFKWRGFWAYGTGALGDMACHTFNMAFMALNLRNPTSVEAVSDEHDGVMYPKSSQIHFKFPELDGRPALDVFWYDGGRMPPSELLKDCPKRVDGEGRESTYDSGALIVGTEGKFFSPGDYGGEVETTGIIRPDGEFQNQRQFAREVKYVRSPGHFVEFANAIRGEGQAMSNFPDYAGPLSETILLGNLAVWAGKKIEWDAAQMIARNSTPDVDALIRHQYEHGYKL